MGLPPELRRSLGCTNAIESLMAVLRQVCRNVKGWRDARMALRWTGTAMLSRASTHRTATTSYCAFCSVRAICMGSWCNRSHQLNQIHRVWMW
jgi:hypothetical protein